MSTAAVPVFRYPDPRYRLNEPRWRDAVRRVELEIRCLKDQMRRPDYQATFDWDLLLRLRAEATRLYAVRAASRGRVHEVKSGRRFAFQPYYKLPFLQFFMASRVGTPTEVQDRVINDDPDWLMGFLEPRDLEMVVGGRR